MGQTISRVRASSSSLSLQFALVPAGSVRTERERNDAKVSADVGSLAERERPAEVKAGTGRGGLSATGTDISPCLAACAGACAFFRRRPTRSLANVHQPQSLLLPFPSSRRTASVLVPTLSHNTMPVATNSPPASTVNLAPYKPGDHETKHADFRDQLFKDGYCVVPGAFSVENSKAYASAGHDWLESFGLGYKRDDPSTFKMENVPAFHKGGLYNNFGVGQEQFAWDVRQEPGIIDAFAKIWGTDELLVSFDAVNLSIPLAKAPGAEGIFKPWAHVDQSPNRQFFHCVQGIANLAENGPDDGGLMVLQGSKELYNECFEKFAHEKPAEGWTDIDSFHHSPAMLDWMVNEKGCTWHKVCAGPGDLILWDSRTVHFGSPPKGPKARTAVYICYKPASLITPEKMEQRKQAMENLWTTTHDPVIFRIIDPEFEPFPNAPGWSVRTKPVRKPVLTERGLKLAGLVPY